MDDHPADDSPARPRKHSMILSEFFPRESDAFEMPLEGVTYEIRDGCVHFRLPRDTFRRASSGEED